MPYSQLIYHFVWSTKYRNATLVPEVEAQVFELIHKKADELGAFIHALNGTEDHTHLVVTLPPAIAPAQFIGQIKGASSSQYNKLRDGGEAFKWQDEYGVFSCDGHCLPKFIEYVMNQKVRHVEGRIIQLLERIDLPTAQQIREDEQH